MNLMLTNLLAVWCLLPLQPPSDTAPAADLAQPALETMLRQVPQSPEETRARLALARERIESLRSLVTPPAEGESEDAAALALRPARESLLRAWESYAKRVERLAALRESVSRLASEAHLNSVGQRIAELEQATAALQALPPPVTATAEAVQQVEAEADALEAEVATLVETQSRRSKQLSGGLQQQREQLEKELKQLREQREALQKTPETPSVAAPPDEPQVELRARALDVQIAAAMVALENVGLERQETELLSKQDERVLSAQRRKLDALRRRQAALVEARSRSRLDVLELRLARTTDGAERALLELDIFHERVVRRYFRRGTEAAVPELRYSQRSRNRLDERISRARVYWDRVREPALGGAYLSGAEARDLQRDLQAQRAEYSRSLEVLRGRLGPVLDRFQQLQAVRDRAVDRFNVLADRALTAADSSVQVDRARVEADITTARAALEEAARQTLGEWEALVNRLESATRQIEDHLAYLAQTDRDLRWVRMTSHDSGLWGFDWRIAGRELAALFTEPTATAVATTTPDEQMDPVEAELFGESDDPAGETRRFIAQIRGNLGGTTGVDWVRSGVLIAIGAVMGWVLRRLAVGKSRRLARRIDMVATPLEPVEPDGAPVVSGISVRMNLLGANLVADLAVPLALSAALAGSLVFVLDDARPQAAFLALIASVTMAVTAWRFVHHLFEADAPAHRPVPCSDRVARHYRLWLSSLILFSALVLPWPWVLHIADASPALQAAIMEVYKTGLLVLLFLFLLRKGHVLGNPAAAAPHIGLVVAWVAYPAFVLAVAGLLIMEIIGFGAMVSYVGSGLLLTLAALIAAAAASEYLGDAIERYAPARLDAENADVQTGLTFRDAPPTPAAGTPFISALLKWLIRLAALTGAILLIIRAWDIPVDFATWNWRVIGFSALAVVIALVFDRIAVTALWSLQRGGRLPRSTAAILRRWIRGMLMVIVVLTIVAISGYEITNLWQFLTAVLAMVAIGFVAVWSILSNILATLVILVWRPFNVGEKIEILPEGIEGQVIDINFLYTILKTDKGTRISVPNNLFAQKFIRRQSVRGVPYRTLAEQLEAETPLER